MSASKNFTFMVDMSSSMIINNASDSSHETRQILFCKCGHRQNFNSKLVRNIIKNYDELTEDSESLKSIKCNKCGCVYNKDEKLYLLEPNSDEIYKTSYSFNYNPSVESIKFNNLFNVEKRKFVAKYCSKRDGLIFKIVVDTLSINVTTGLCKLNMSSPFEKNESIYIAKSESDKLNKDISETVDITNVKFLEEFFSYTDSIKYLGIEHLSESMQELKYHIKDLDKFDSVYFIDFIKNKHKINSEKDGLGNLKYYQEVDSGFGDGKIIKKRLNIGDYLFNTMNSYKLIVSMISFENASCIIHTKGYNFFKNWIESNFILEPAVYKSHKATNPNAIMEVSINFEKNGQKRVPRKIVCEENDNREMCSGIKVSSTINSSIKLISNLEAINECSYFDYISKENLEYLFQNYKSDRVYGLISKVNKSLFNSSDFENINSNETIKFKNIKHILDSNIDQDGSDYLTTYIDTIRVIDLLEVKYKIIFKCKSYDQLKDLHDDYSSRYNAMKDAKKSQFYLKSIAPFVRLNMQVGDVKLEVVESAERLNLEGLQMQHCIYTYLNRICDKEYLAVNVTHVITKERATAGFVRKGDKLYLEQLKGYYNSRATAELIESTLEFCRHHNISSKNTYSSDMSVDVGRQRKMPGQLSESELISIRKKKKKENKTSEKETENGNVVSFIKKIFK
tara:strand:- start:480 stop:2516 length:2037 start_codon:yes stop_codon:yes gene_type:complete